MSRTCDLHDSCGVNVATYLWDNLWRDIEKIRPQCDPSQVHERTTTKSKFIRYLCFIFVVFIHSCHYRLKISSLSLKKTYISINQSISPAVMAIYAATAFTILKGLEYEFLKRVLIQGRQQSIWKFTILSNVLDLEWCLSNKWQLHSTTVRHVYYLSRWQRWRA